MIDNGHNFFIRVQNSGNYILVRDDVGKPKPNLRSLPGSLYTYGKKTFRDKESAKDLIYTWSESPKANYPRAEKDYKKLNILSIEKKITQAVKLRQFRKRTWTSNSKKKPEKSTPDISFGQAARPCTPIKAILSNFYGEQASKQKHIDYKQEVLKILENKKKLIAKQNLSEQNTKLLRRRSTE